MISDCSGLGEKDCNNEDSCQWCAGTIKGNEYNDNCIPKDRYNELCKPYDKDDDVYQSFNDESRIRQIDSIINKVPASKREELLEERDELDDERDELKKDQIEDSARTMNQTRNCLNSDLGSEYEKYGCDLNKLYIECKKNYSNGKCMLYTTTGEFVNPSLETAISGEDENGYSCPQNFSCDEEVSVGGFACPGNVAPLDPSSNDGLVCPKNPEEGLDKILSGNRDDGDDGDNNIDEDEDGDEYNYENNYRRRERKRERRRERRRMRRMNNRYSDNDNGISLYDKINKNITSRIWNRRGEGVNSVGIEYDESSLFSISNMTIYFIIIVIVIIVIIAIILLIISLKRQKVCSTEGMIEMINKKIAQQKSNIEKIKPGFLASKLKNMKLNI